ncbi:hypothetical protein GIS00_02720 [Nakamurella sp. YIM 132087]|uniref:Uncharacterized protein n=1 Tax=Nakamurella alba TaxID=2665158 RepID=A0A7K1FFH8_9ACTN|nr:hypothetical protein [Nakamurella alba]MTD12858.1 hypothetical protein [Nakamurella alba]
MTAKHRPAPGPRAAALGAVISVAALLVGLALPAAGSAPAAAPAPGIGAVQAAAPAPGSTTAGDLTLTADPATEVSPDGSIAVTGSGFDRGKPLFLAVCPIQGDEVGDRSGCMGGSVPDANESDSWAYVTRNGADTPEGGGVTARYDARGGFELDLDMTVGELNCATTACGLVTAYEDGGGQVVLPLTFAAAEGQAPAAESSSTSSESSSTSSAPPTTSTSASPPRTVEALTVESPSVQAGRPQEVIFAGFMAGETVAVTLYSDPITLPSVTADEDGVVRVTFDVPTDLPAGTHILQVVGSRTRTTGVARFVVTAIPTTSSSPTTSSTPTTSSSSSSASSSSSSTSSSTSSPTTSSIPTTSSATSSAAPPVTPTGSSSRPVWPWFVLAAIVLIWAGIGIFFWRRRVARRRDDGDDGGRYAYASDPDPDPVGPDTSDLPTTALPPEPGWEHPDHPQLFSGQNYRWPGEATAPGIEGEPPTQQLPPTARPTEQIPPMARPTEQLPPSGYVPPSGPTPAARPFEPPTQQRPPTGPTPAAPPTTGATPAVPPTGPTPAAPPTTGATPAVPPTTGATPTVPPTGPAPAASPTTGATPAVPPVTGPTPTAGPTPSTGPTPTAPPTGPQHAIRPDPDSGPPTSQWRPEVDEFDEDENGDEPPRGRHSR